MLWSLLEMTLLLSYRNMGELFTSDRYVELPFVAISDIFCCFYPSREVIDAISIINYLTAFFVYSDSFQVLIADWMFCQRISLYTLWYYYYLLYYYLLQCASYFSNSNICIWLCLIGGLLHKYVHNFYNNCGLHYILSKNGSDHV